MEARRHAEAERNLKIERLLDPLTRHRRDAAYGLAGDAVIDWSALQSPAFVHYTSADAALAIIEQKSMWMRNATSMDDWSEVKHGHQILVNYFTEEERRGRFLTACDRIFAESGFKALERFDGWWNSIQWNTYITSVSEMKSRHVQHQSTSPLKLACRNSPAVVSPR